MRREKTRGRGLFALRAPAAPGAVLLASALAVAAAFGAAAPAISGIATDVDAVLEGSPLLIYGHSAEEAAAVIANLELEGKKARLMPALAVSEEAIAASDILVFGTPATNPLISRCLRSSPFRLDERSVTVGDSTFEGTDIRLVATLPNPANPERKCILYAAQDEELLSGIFFGYGASYLAADFAAYRKSDGLYYPDDRLAYGDLVRTSDGVKLGEVTYNGREPRRLLELETGHVRLYYDTLDAAEASTIARFVDALYDVAAGEFGIKMPRKIYVYIYSAVVDPTRIRMYTDAWNTFWSKMTLPKDRYLRMSVTPVAFAHEVARLAFQPVVGDSTKRHPFSPYDDDWSHYFQFMVLVPSVWERLGPSGWPAPNDFHETWGSTRFRKLYRGAEDTYAWLLWAIEQQYGRPIIGKTLNEVTHGGARRNVPVEEFMARLAEATGDTTIIRKVEEALPTTLEWSISRRIAPLGFYPRLDQMIEDHSFVIDSVAAGSPADRERMRVGDEIVGINGFDLQTQKARAHRSVLEAIPVEGAIRLAVRHGDRTTIHEMKIRKP